MKIEIIEGKKRKIRKWPVRAKMPRGGNKKPKTRKVSKAAKLRLWGLPDGFKWGHLRYKQPYQKGVLWHFFSRYIRARDVARYGTCISCGRAITMETCDAGHFMPTSSCGRDLIFDEGNVNGECNHCNAWDGTHLLGYAEGLDLRYGEGSARTLRDRKEAYKSGPPLKDFSTAQYENSIAQYKEKLASLAATSDLSTPHSN